MLEQFTPVTYENGMLHLPVPLLRQWWKKEQNASLIAVSLQLLRIRFERANKLIRYPVYLRKVMSGSVVELPERIADRMQLEEGETLYFNKQPGENVMFARLEPKKERRLMIKYTDENHSLFIIKQAVYTDRTADDSGAERPGDAAEDGPP